MTADRGLRLWVAAVAVAASTLFVTLLVLALVPDEASTIHGEAFDDAVQESQTEQAAASGAARDLRMIVALALAIGTPLGLCIGGVLAFRRSRAALTEGR